jgi:hypothetical protein
VPIADLLFNQEFIIWVIGPFVVSLAVLITGLFVRSDMPTAGWALVVIRVGGFVLSAGWVAFLFWVDAVLGDT